MEQEPGPVYESYIGHTSPSLAAEATEVLEGGQFNVGGGGTDGTGALESQIPIHIFVQ